MSNNKQLVKNSIYSIASFIINLFISFFFTPYLIRVVGKEAYSFFPLVNSIVGYSSIISTAVGGMAGRFVTMRIYKKDSEGAAYYYNSVLLANWILSLFFTLLSAVVVIYLDRLLTIPQNLDSEVKALFAFACASSVLGLMTNILGLGCFVKNRLDLTSSRTMVTSLFRVGIILLCFSIFRPSIVYMSSSAFFAAIILAFYNIRFKGKLLPEIPLNVVKYFKWTYLKEVMSSSVWSSINQLGMILVTQLDLLITNIFIGVSATGDYSIAKTIPTLMIQFIATLSSVFVPSFNILYAKGEKQNLMHEIAKSIKLMGIFSAIPIGFLMMYGKAFFNLWVPGQNTDVIFELSQLTLIPLLFNGAVNPLFHIYAVVNKVKLPSIAFVFFGLLQTAVVLSLLSCTNLGLWAIPIGSLVVNIIKLLTFVPMYAAKCLGLPYSFFHNQIIKVVSSCFFTLVIGWLCINLLPSNTWTLFVLNGVIVCSSSLVLIGWLYLNKAERQYLLRKLGNRKILNK